MNSVHIIINLFNPLNVAVGYNITYNLLCFSTRPTDKANRPKRIFPWQGVLSCKLLLSMIPDSLHTCCYNLPVFLCFAGGAWGYRVHCQHPALCRITPPSLSAGSAESVCLSVAGTLQEPLYPKHRHKHMQAHTHTLLLIPFESSQWIEVLISY